MKRKLTRTSKVLIICVVLLLVLSASLGIFFIKQASEPMREMLNGKMLDIAKAAASMIDGDVLRDIQAEDKDTPEYKKIIKTLTFFQENMDFKYVYCVRGIGNRKFVLTLDPTTVKEEQGEFGESVVTTDALFQASLGTPAAEDRPYTDRWGTFYSAYAPVFDSNGRVGGIVAVDYKADWYEKQSSRWIRNIIIVTIFALPVGVIIVLVITHKARKRYRTLYEELDVLADGIETLSAELAGGDMLDQPAPAFPDTDVDSPSDDDISAMENRIRMLQEYMSIQIDLVRKKAYIDGLTGLGNRFAYDDYMAVMNDDIKDGTAAFSVAMFDINGLKEVNDRNGHGEGDKLILKSAEVLKEIFEGDKLFRIGGDEFVVIMSQTGEEAGALIEKFEKLNSDTTFGGREHALMSVGFAEYDRSKDHFFLDTFDRADKDMYESKKKFYEAYGNRRRN